jgi:hypothetical protein
LLELYSSSKNKLNSSKNAEDIEDFLAKKKGGGFDRSTIN